MDSFKQFSDNIVPGETWHAFISNYKVIKQFIIRGIDEKNEEPETVRCSLRSLPEWDSEWTPPFEVSKLRRRVRAPEASTSSRNTINKTDTSYVYIDTDLYIAKFKTIYIPTSLIFMSKRVFLDPLIARVRRCNACQRFGHLAQYCRSGTAAHRIICERYGEKGHSKSVCTGPPVHTDTMHQLR